MQAKDAEINQKIIYKNQEVYIVKEKDNQGNLLAIHKDNPNAKLSIDKNSKITILTKTTFEEIQEQHPNLTKQTKEWITEGWGINDDNPTPEQYAAAWLMEANTQEQYENCNKEFPKLLRQLAFKLLHSLHEDPTQITK